MFSKKDSIHEHPGEEGGGCVCRQGRRVVVVYADRRGGWWLCMQTGEEGETGRKRVLTSEEHALAEVTAHVVHTDSLDTEQVESVGRHRGDDSLL